MNDNLDTPADAKAKETKVFNSIVTYWASQHEVQPSEREAALDRIQKLSKHTISKIQNYE